MHCKTSILGAALLASVQTAHAGVVYSLAANLTVPKQLALASYRLVDNYNAGNFFNSFNFYSGADPTHGYVNYRTKGDAQNMGLINSNNNQVYMGVDSNTVNPGSPGRSSVRVSSNKAYTHGLFIADIAHMPGNACGVWPAYWLFGPNWPASGEIDVIEGVNLAGSDSITLHTSPGCYMNIAGSRSGTTLSDTNCNANNGNNGCSATAAVANSYGDGFNSVGGGVYAMQWESSGIYVWFFPRNAIPSDISSGNPVTGNWGLPIVAFNGNAGCNVDAHFANQNIVFDTTFCGDWAGGAFASGSCASQGSCESYVAGNPRAFSQAYWSVNSVKVYSL